MAKAKEMAIGMKLPNKDQASAAFVKQIDLNENDLSVYPQRINRFELTNWVVKPEDHQWYAKTWSYLVFGNVFVNTFLWIYL